MTSVAQPYSPHPAGLQQHPGAAQGHPMAGVHPQQGGPPGPGMPQQAFHMGVSGPGVPQVSQPGAMMAGMSPGINGPGGPNAHALQHLNPNHAMYQQQQQQMACTCKISVTDLLILPIIIPFQNWNAEHSANMVRSCQSTNANGATTTHAPTNASATGASRSASDAAAI